MCIRDSHDLNQQPLARLGGQGHVHQLIANLGTHLVIDGGGGVHKELPVLRADLIDLHLSLQILQSCGVLLIAQPVLLLPGGVGGFCNDQMCISDRC